MPQRIRTDVVIAITVATMALEVVLDLFSVLLIGGMGFATAACMVKPRVWNAVLAGQLYVPAMTIFIFWIGIRSGYYDMP